MNKRKTGSGCEKQAADFLRSQGFRIREMNYRVRQGEIDIVAEEGRYLVFVEVKYRRSNAMGSPYEAVDYRKRRQISRIALFYLASHGLSEDTPVRFDVVGVSPEGAALLRNAFDFAF